MRLSTTALLAAAALAVSACSDASSGPSAEESAVQQAYLDADPGYLDENPGGDALLADPTLTASSTLFSAPGDPYIAPEHWGRRRLDATPRRVRIVLIDRDTAKVGVTVEFRGRFLVDTTFDGVVNPGSKRIHELLQQRAVFVRDDTAPRGWRLIALSLGNIVDAVPERRTVEITSMALEVNGNPVGEVTDPTQLFRLDGSVPQIKVGDEVRVTVAVRNTTGTDLVPPTQVFLHLRHHRPDSDAWGRIQMQDNGDGTFSLTWTVRRPGVGRMAVDAIDSEALQTQSGDNYRANLWAFPYRAIP